MSFHKICHLEDILDGHARGFEVTVNEQTVPVICIRQGCSAFVYKNSCPHTGVNLEWQPDQFLDDTLQYIVCSSHGALFQVEDGYCVAGPCAGDSLKILPIELNEGELYVDMSNADEAVSN